MNLEYEKINKLGKQEHIFDKIDWKSLELSLKRIKEK